MRYRLVIIYAIGAVYTFRWKCRTMHSRCRYPPSRFRTILLRRGHTPIQWHSRPPIPKRARDRVECLSFGRLPHGNHYLTPPHPPILPPCILAIRTHPGGCMPGPVPHGNSQSVMPDRQDAAIESIPASLHRNVHTIEPWRICSPCGAVIQSGQSQFRFTQGEKLR